jgi:cytochrome c nitrite reductase small subunit
LAGDQYRGEISEKMGTLYLNRWKILIGVFLLGVIGSAGGLFLSFGPPDLMAKTETPLFCASCHNMESNYGAWFRVGAHRTVRCVDCHLPHQNMGVYYLWKSIDGLWDVAAYYSGRAPEKIIISERQQRVVQANCIRCHEARVTRIDQERRCWDCHRWLQHNLSVARMTR